jgi:predicted  nucleic acid-binding Zn-ribbon protein
MNTKVIPIILVIIILAVGIIAFNFYQGLQAASKKNAELTEENTGLVETNNSLTNKYNQVSREKADTEQRLALIEEELSRIQEERDGWKQKWADISRERDDLVEKLKESPRTSVVVSSSTVEPGEISEEHWADFVAKKATLEAKLDTLNQTLMDAKAKLAEVDKNNKELSIKIDQLTKDKERLTEEIKFKERTLRVMSMDLVSERGERSAAVGELRKLRSENVNLKREIVVANKEKMRLQTTLKSTMETKEELENRISEVENYMKDKSLAFEELQDQLSQTIAGAKRVTSFESASVELPPIVVKPSAPDLRGLRGEVIAVNEEESFIVVDIGESAGLRPGFLLKVMRQGREVGTVEIIETRAEISAADVRETVSGFNIQEGDLVVSR